MVIVPERLAETCHRVPERSAWLDRLPDAIHQLQDKWSLSLGVPFDGGDVSCAWVAPVMRADGTRAVLKLGMPHFEGAHEIQALRFWDGGGPTVRLLADETLAVAHQWPDAGLVQEGLRLFDELSRPSAADALLATDLRAGNVLQAQREPWLVIDPKPFVGDRAYDATQHLSNCKGRMLTAPDATIHNLADLLGVDAERVRLWMFARSAAEPPDTWDEDSVALARLLA
jgi:streptomycin 6-kinase